MLLVRTSHHIKETHFIVSCILYSEWVRFAHSTFSPPPRFDIYPDPIDLPLLIIHHYEDNNKDRGSFLPDYDLSGVRPRFARQTW